MLIAQITDLHAGDRVDVDGRIIDTLDYAARAVSHLNALAPRPDAVVVTGDLVAEEQLEHYEAVAEVLAALAMPYYVIPGNHDDRVMIRQTFGDAGYLPSDGPFLHYTIEDWPLRIVALDTQNPGKESGLLCPERLDWIGQRLAEAPDTPTLLVMHHPPFTTGIHDFDRMCLKKPEPFAEIVTQNSQIKAITCGHVHRDITVSWCGTLAAITPSTGYQYCLQLSANQKLAKVAEPPATRLFLWDQAAGLRSHISYIPYD